MRTATQVLDHRTYWWKEIGQGVSRHGLLGVACPLRTNYQCSPEQQVYEPGPGIRLRACTSHKQSQSARAPVARLVPEAKIHPPSTIKDCGTEISQLQALHMRPLRRLHSKCDSPRGTKPYSPTAVITPQSPRFSTRTCRTSPPRTLARAHVLTPHPIRRLTLKQLTPERTDNPNQRSQLNLSLHRNPNHTDRYPPDPSAKTDSHTPSTQQRHDTPHTHTEPAPSRHEKGPRGASHMMTAPPTGSDQLLVKGGAV